MSEILNKSQMTEEDEAFYGKPALLGSTEERHCRNSTTKLQRKNTIKNDTAAPAPRRAKTHHCKTGRTPAAM